MDWQNVHAVLVVIQHVVSIIGIFIIVTGVVLAFSRYLLYFFSGTLLRKDKMINEIRLHLGRTLILGLEFIVAADLIGSTTTPDYYSVGLLAIIVIVRTILSFSLNRELASLNREEGRAK